MAALAGLARGAGLEAEVLVGTAPTPGAVRERLESATFVHLATHGFFAEGAPTAGAARAGGSGKGGAAASRASARRNPLVGSGLALAGANAGPAGLVTAEELLGLDLGRARLVALSACETGRGAEVDGQGVLGLRAALAAAGAGAVLMSLWAVPDEATAALMEAFYRALWAGGLGPAEALREAQTAVRADARFAAPLHWAAWTLAGAM